MSDRFVNRVAVVTGGASGIGEGIARQIAVEGGKVVVFDLDRQGLDRAAQEYGFIPMLVNVGVEQEVRQAVEQVVAQFGQLDIMVNSAGIVGPTSIKILDYPSDELEKVLQVNLYGSIYTTKYALKPMLERNYGRILLLSSMAGKDGNPGMVGYSISKAAVIGLVKSVGKEYADTGITVNGIAPAVIRTPINEKTSPEQLRYLTERIPMKRLGTVAEAASLACWIVSEAASFNTGFIFDLSGGRATY